MKLRLDLSTDANGYSMEADLDFDEKRPGEYIGVGYAYAVLGVMLIKFQEKLLKQAANVQREHECERGQEMAAAEARLNEMWPFDATRIEDR